MSSNAADTEFNIHSSCYSDFFLLRTPITINERPAVIKTVNGEPMLKVRGISVKLSAILHQAMAPVTRQHGVYQVENFYFEQVALFLVTFTSKLSLKQFLTNKEAVQKELSSAIGNLFKAETKSSQPQSLQSHSMPEQFQVVTDMKFYLVSPSLCGHSPEVNRINLANHSFMFDTWKRSKLFDFTNTMFTKPPTANESGDQTAVSTTVGDPPKVPITSHSQNQDNSTTATPSNKSGDESAELAALQVELRGVTEWFSLGVQLKIPTDELLTIRKDHRYTYDCRLEMLIRWEQLEKPTWTKLITALVNIGRRDLAEKIAKKYRLPLPVTVAPTCSSDLDGDKQLESVGSGKQSQANNLQYSGESILLLENEVEKATQSRNSVSNTLEMDIDTTLPELQVKVSSLSETVRVLKTKLKNREEENEMLDEANQSLNLKWNEAIQRTRRENIEAIKVLREKIKKKEDELAQIKAQLSNKGKELSEKIRELDIKSARVFELQTELEETRQKFDSQQNEMDQKLIESEALALSRDKYLEEIEIQRDIAVKEANKKKEELQSYAQDLSDKEEQISRLSEKITEQDREMVKLREELDSHQRTSEHLSAEQMKEDEEKEKQLFTLVMSAMKLQLELQRTKDKKNQDKMNLEGAKKTVEEYDKMLELSNLKVKNQSSADEHFPQVIDIAEKPPSLPRSDTPLACRSEVTLRNVIALYSYTGRSDQELSFKKGDILQVTEKRSPDWWCGIDSDGKQGFIPVNYVEIQESSTNGALIVQDKVRAKEELVNRKETQLASQHQQNGKEIVQTPLSEPKLPLVLKWSRGKNIPFNIWGGPSAVVMNGDVYLGGGDASSDTDEQIVLVYNPTRNSWSLLPSYNYSCFSLTVIDESMLVAVGGEDPSTLKVTNKLAVWDSKQRQWVFNLPPMTTACSSPAVATYNHWLLVAGGHGEHSILSRVEVMNVLTHQWYQVASLPVALARISSTMIGNMWYLMSGYTANGPSKSVMSVCVEHIISEAISQLAGETSSTLPQNQSRWNKVTFPDTPLEFSTAFSFKGALLAIGGGTFESPSSDIHIYQPSTSKWTKAGDTCMPVIRYMPAYTLLPNGHIMIIGGLDTS